MSENNNSLYCEKCDKWLDSPSDYINKGTDDVGNQYQCKACGSIAEKFVVSSYFFCGYCFKKTCDKEWWNRPNWRARMKNEYGLSHDFPTEEEARRGEGKITINHDCWLECKTCNKKYQLTNENVMILVEHFYGNPAACPSCLIKELKERVANGRADEQDKTTLSKLEAISNNNPHRESPKTTIPNSLKEYFQKNNIESLELAGDNWIINSKRGNAVETVTIATDAVSELQEAKSYLQSINKKSISKEELTNISVSNPTNSNNKTNYLPWILGIGGVLVLVIGIVWLVNRNKKET